MTRRRRGVDEQGQDVWEYEDGRVEVIQSGPAIGAAPPEQRWKEPQAGADYNKTKAGIDSTVTGTAKTGVEIDEIQAGLPYVAPKAAAQTEREQWEANEAARNRGVQPTIAKAARELFNDTVEIGDLLKATRQRFVEGPGATSGVAGLVDFVPGIPRNTRFDTSANQMRGYAKQAQGTTGGEVNTVAEMKMNIGAFIPSSNDSNSEAKDKMASIQREREKGMKRAITVLGGMPDQNGYITPIPRGYTVGEHPSLDFSIAKHLSSVPKAERQSWMLAVRQRFLAKLNESKKTKRPAAAPEPETIDFQNWKR